MKRIILFLFIILPLRFVFGADYSKIDNQSRTVPDNLKTIDEISTYLTKGLTTPTDKSRAIFYWISHNIKYNDDILNTTSNRYDRGKILAEVLQTRQGVCQHFAELFHACCESVGVKSYVISGYTRQESQLDPLSHAWNCVLIDSRYYGVDVTWAAAAIGNSGTNAKLIDQYFLVPAAEFIKTHMPFDPIWQFSSNPITNSEFVMRDFSKLKISSNFNYYDSINKLALLSVLDRMIRENSRIVKCGLTNSLVRDRAELNLKNINLKKYNLAVETYNKGVAIYNSYLNSKYKNFRNLNSNQNRIRNMLALSQKQINQAELMLSGINTTNKDIARMVQNMQAAIKIQNKKIRKENAFVTDYFKAWKPLRILMD